MLGKRKRRASLDLDNSSSSSSPLEPQSTETDVLGAKLRAHFESQFAPLHLTPLTRARDSTSAAQIETEKNAAGREDEEKLSAPTLAFASGSASAELDSENDWFGLSADESPNGVEIVEAFPLLMAKTEMAADAVAGLLPPSRRARRDFMTSKPPSSTLVPKSSRSFKTASSQNGAEAAESPQTAAAMLQADLELHRLISESHILHQTESFAARPRPTPVMDQSHPLPSSSKTRHSAPTKSARLATLAHRLDQLGAAPAAQRMPMAQAQGIARARHEREAARRREASESGIILERNGRSGNKNPGSERAGSKSLHANRVAMSSARPIGHIARHRPDRVDVGAPAVGCWKGGTLTLRKSDVRAITGDSGQGGQGRQGRQGRQAGLRRGR